ncbi:MAG TPA: LysR family transcriptional regulator [Steroidobacteraceae bacterium]|jgi:DNA-binding transcriptional LysR family regulator
MSAFTLHDLQCFDAVVRSGSFQAAAELLHRSHPAVFAAVAKLERQLGLELLDRSGYRVRLTDSGSSLHARAQSLLREAMDLGSYAAQLATGEETELNVVIGDVCPRPQVLALLARFFADRPRTRLHLHYEAVSGPWERLIDGDADLILHRVDKTDLRVEWLDLCRVSFMPVVAPGFLPFPLTDSIEPQQLRSFTQCVIRDTARNSPVANYFLIEGAHQCTVADQPMKKEVVLSAMSWGHLPHFLIAEELRDGRLLSLTGKHLPGRTEEVVAARIRDRSHGPVANALWRYLGERANEIGRSVDAMNAASRS